MEIDYSIFTEKARAALKKAFQMTKDCQYALVEPQIMMVSLLQEGKDMVAFMLNLSNVRNVISCPPRQVIGFKLCNYPIYH